MNFYPWLLLLHLAALIVFLAAHGVSITTAFVMRKEPDVAASRALLRASIGSYKVVYPALVTVAATGLAMTIVGGWWRFWWPWISTSVLVAMIVAMGFMAEPYRRARGAGDIRPELSSALAAAPARMAWVGGGGFMILVWLMVFKPL